MQVFVGDLKIEFTCDDGQAESQLGLIFSGWPQHPEWLATHCTFPRSQSNIHFTITVADSLTKPALNARQIYYDQGGTQPVQDNVVNLYLGKQELFVQLGADAASSIPLATNVLEEQVQIQARITERGLQQGRLEDLIFCSLAPVFRRHGYFMIHAFAAAKEGQAILLVGQSGSGKTTAGLSLVLRGWQYLANDVLLLGEEAGVVYAWPTPGGISLSPESFDLLPRLPRPVEVERALGKKHSFPAMNFANGWAAPAPVRLICFPQVVRGTSSHFRRQAQSVTLARLMETSIDRWDTIHLDSHIDLLEGLCRQAQAYEWWLGDNLNRMSDTLDQTWSSSPD